MKQTLTTLSSALILCLAVAISACSTDSATGPTGRYALQAQDKEQFAGNTADALVTAGQIPPAARELAVEQLRTAEINLDLEADKTFSFDQTVQGKRMVFTGTWDLNGSTVRLNQTHENGKEVADTMDGELRDGRLTLTMTDSSASIEFVLSRSGTPASPR